MARGGSWSGATNPAKSAALAGARRDCYASGPIRCAAGAASSGRGMDAMKFKADRATLMKALAHVQSVVEKRNTIPILANVMIAAAGGKITLTATDMEI